MDTQDLRQILEVACHNLNFAREQRLAGNIEAAMVAETAVAEFNSYFGKGTALSAAWDLFLTAWECDCSTALSPVQELPEFLILWHWNLLPYKAMDSEEYWAACEPAEGVPGDWALHLPCGPIKVEF